MLDWVGSTHCTFAFPVFLCYNRLLGVVRDADERERILGNGGTGLTGDPHGAVSRGGSGKLRAASTVSRHRYGHQRA